MDRTLARIVFAMLISCLAIIYWIESSEVSVDAYANIASWEDVHQTSIKYLNDEKISRSEYDSLQKMHTLYLKKKIVGQHGACVLKKRDNI